MNKEYRKDIEHIIASVLDLPDNAVMVVLTSTDNQARNILRSVWGEILDMECEIYVRSVGTSNRHILMMNGARVIFRPAGDLQWLQGIEIYHVHLAPGVGLKQYEVDEINSRMRCGVRGL